MNCTNNFAAKNCPNEAKCCLSTGFCAENEDDCQIYMIGHCKFLQCDQCCVRTVNGHYCGGWYDCESQVKDLVYYAIYIYVALVIIFLLMAFYKRYKTRRIFQAIKQKSEDFQRRRNRLRN
ncbi:hypothetical protein pb186bvf_008763 [Paramecium bursaria]